MKESPGSQRLSEVLFLFDWNTWLYQSISLRYQLLNQTGALVWMLTGMWMFRKKTKYWSSPCYQTGEEEEEKAGWPTHLWYVDWCGPRTKVTWESQTSPASNRGGWLDNRQVAVAVAVALSLLISFRFKTQSRPVRSQITSSTSNDFTPDKAV